MNRAIWTNTKGEKITVNVLAEFCPLNMPVKCRVQKTTATNCSYVFLVNKDQLEYVTENPQAGR